MQISQHLGEQFAHSKFSRIQSGPGTPRDIALTLLVDGRKLSGMEKPAAAIVRDSLPQGPGLTWINSRKLDRLNKHENQMF